MEYGKDVLKSLVPTQRLDLDQNDSYSLYVPPKSPLSESIPAMLGISYGSMLFEVENYSNYPEEAEKTNGRWAMIGMIALFGAYITTGQIIPGLF